MNYGLYLSAAGVITNLHRQDVLASLPQGAPYVEQQ